MIRIGREIQCLPYEGFLSVPFTRGLTKENTRSSDFALPDSVIPNPQLGILSLTGNLISPIGNIMPNWAYFLFFAY